MSTRKQTDPIADRALAEQQAAEAGDNQRALASGQASTPDLGGTATTAQITQAVCAALEGKNL